MPNVWVDKEWMCLKLFEDCIHEYKLNDNVVINPYLNLNELIYGWSWKIVVTDYLPENGSPLTING